MLPILPVVAAAVHPAAAQITEADWIRWAGVVVGIAGALIVAPGGSALILHEATGHLRSCGRLIRSHLSLRKPSPGRVVRTHTVIAGDAGSFTEGQAVQRSEPSNADVIGTLWRDLEHYSQQARALEEEMHAKLTVLDAADAEQRDAHAALVRQRAADERREARVDARGLPLIGLGILLTGVPDGLATWAWAGWVLLALAGILTLWLAVWPFLRLTGGRLRATPASSQTGQEA